MRETGIRFVVDNKDLIKDLLVAQSLACLCFVRIWGAILNPKHSQYFAETIQNRLDYFAVLINTLLVMSAAFVAGRVARRLHTPLAYRIACVSLFLALLPFIDYLRRAFNIPADKILIASNGVPAIVAAALFLFILFRYYAALNRGIYAGLLVLAPFSIMSVSSAVYLGISGNNPEDIDDSKPFSATQNPPPSSRRTIWVIFDELDQGVLFQRRPASLALPNLDQFSRESVLAENAYPPAGRTILSIPSLLLGKIVERAEINNENQLRLHFRREPKATIFRDTPSLINDFSRAGKRVAMVGWYFPYERIFPETDTRWVRWGAFPQTQGFTGRTVPEAVAAQWRNVFYPQSTRNLVGDLYGQLHRDSLLAVSSPAADFVFLHYPTPHPPGIFDPKSGRITGAYTSSVDGYLNNLQLVDRALGEIMAAVKSSGLEARTTIIISSDHWWRGAAMLDGQLDLRVPFMIRFPSAVGAKFTPTFNTVVSAELVRELQSGEIKDEADAMRFLQGKSAPAAFRYGPAGNVLNE